MLLVRRMVGVCGLAPPPLPPPSPPPPTPLAGCCGRTRACSGLSSLGRPFAPPWCEGRPQQRSSEPAGATGRPGRSGMGAYEPEELRFPKVPDQGRSHVPRIECEGAGGPSSRWRGGGHPSACSIRGTRSVVARGSGRAPAWVSKTPTLIWLRHASG